MTRKEFLKLSAIVGIGTPLMSSFLWGCNSDDDDCPRFTVNFSGKVIIIGAGAAGLTAGHLLHQHGIDFEILEAGNRYGGRMKEIIGFADFPIDLGAEWIHTDPTILGDLLNDCSETDKIDIINYNPQTVSVYTNGELRKRNFFSNFYAEHKFKSTTWFNYFDKYFVSNFIDKINLNQVVNSIDYSGNQIQITTEDGVNFTADRVVLTVPLTVLQQELISFTPALESDRIDAYNGMPMPGGLKVFFEFKTRFYPDMTMPEGLFPDEGEGEKIFYDAAFRKDSDRNILGFFMVGEESDAYTQFDTDQELIDFLIAELDEIFDGEASKNLVKAVVQNWSKEPYIMGSYTHERSQDQADTIRASRNGKLFFAGEAYAPEDWATVHGAANSAYDAIEELLKG